MRCQLTGPLFCRADAALFEAAAGLDAATLRAGRAGTRFVLEETLAAGVLLLCSLQIAREPPCALEQLRPRRVCARLGPVEGNPAVFG